LRQEYVKKVVFEMSKDSNFFKNQERMSASSTEKIRRTKEHLAALTQVWSRSYTYSVTEMRGPKTYFVR
jgi:hypothetical protein